MASILTLYTALAVLGCLTGRLVGPRFNLCPYRLGGQLAAAFPVVAGLAMMFPYGPERGTGMALDSVAAGSGAIVGVFLTGHRSRLLACIGAFLGSLLGAGAVAPFLLR